MNAEEAKIVSDVQESLCRVFCTTLPMDEVLGGTRHTNVCSELTRAMAESALEKLSQRGSHEDLQEAMDLIQKIRAKTPASLLDADINFEIRKIMIKHRIPV